MSKKKNNISKQKNNIIKKKDIPKLPIIAGIIVLVAIVVSVFVTRNKDTQSNIIEDQIIVSIDDITSNISLIDYDIDGTTIQMILVKDSSGEIRGAYNTCQTCKGSPYAYFIQNGDYLICQNCGLSFSIDDMGDARNGCNPIPLEFKIVDNNVVINIQDITSHKSEFLSWKRGL